MQTDKEAPFTQILAHLIEDETVSLPLLYRLSDMTPEEHAHFVARWPAVPDARRHEIVQHLADIMEINFEVEFGPVFAMGLDDPSAAVREAALDGLWDSEDVKLIRPIVRRLQLDESVAVRAAAARTLAHYILLGEWGRIAPENEALIVNALLRQYRDPETALPIRCAALEALGAAHHDDVADLIESAYESAAADLQASALFAMGNSADPRWIGILIDEMESPYVEMRLQAVRAAGEIGHTEAIDALSEAVFDMDDGVGIEALLSLGRIGSSQATQILSQIASDPELAHLHDAVDEALELSASANLDFLDFSLDDDFLAA